MLPKQQFKNGHNGVHGVKCDGERTPNEKHGLWHKLEHLNLQLGQVEQPGFRSVKEEPHTTDPKKSGHSKQIDLLNQRTVQPDRPHATRKHQLFHPHDAPPNSKLAAVYPALPNTNHWP